MATKKTTTSKRKTAPKKTTAKPSPASVSSSNTWLGWVVAVLLAGVLLGQQVTDQHWLARFAPENDMVVVGNKTWLPVGGQPISVVVLSDENCGSACDTKAGLDSLRASVTPAIMVEEVDLNSARGQALVEAFDLVSIPQYFFGLDIEDFELEDMNGEMTKFIDNLPPTLLTKKEGLYYIDGAQVGFKPGKFIQAPAWADLESEPSKGDGPVEVVEFTNYQCSYCKRFHDQNITLIDQLVADGVITYTVKDYPMFGRNDRYAHRAANCVQQLGGNEAYWQMNAALFDSQSEWSQNATPEAYFNDLALSLGYDVATCVTSADIEAEIQADMREGTKYGVSGTPSVFVGTQTLPGAVGPAVLKAAVEAEAK